MMENKVSVGVGTIQSFKEEYDKINSRKGVKCNASQLFPRSKTPDGSTIYEYIIYYTLRYD